MTHLLFKNSLFVRILAVYIVVIVVLLGILALVSINIFDNIYYQETYRRMESNLKLICGSTRVSADKQELELMVKSLAKKTDARVTLINKDGVVLSDSEKDASSMENHKYRQEIVDARAKGIGEDIHYSNTLGYNMLYVAMPCGEAVIRLAIPLKQVNMIPQHIAKTVGLAFAILLVLAVFIGFWFLKRVVRPIEKMVARAEAIAHGDFGQKVIVVGGDEIGTLAGAINQMSDELKKRFDEINQRKAMLNAVLSNIGEGIIAIDKNQRIRFANSAAEGQFNFDVKQAEGRYIWEIIRNDQLIEFIKESANNSFLTSTYKEIQSAASPSYRVYCSAIKSGESVPEGFIIVVQDVTEAMKYEQLRKDFVANVSHELRTPLTFITGYVDTLKDGAIKDSAKALEFLEIIGKNVQQLTNLVNDLLELSRMESHAGALKIRPVNIETLINRIAVNFAPAVSGKNLNLSVEIGPDMAEALVDPDFLEKAIGNLLDNAIKYSPINGKIVISAKKELSNLIITVSDTGIGIPPEDLDRIFERFYRVDKSRSREMGGTGLGLAIAKHIVQLHNGEITVRSELNKGSNFTIRLPLSPAK